MLVTPAHELMQGERDFVGMRCAPCNKALELDGIVGDGADFYQLVFNDLRVSHRNFSMAHFVTGQGRLSPGQKAPKKISGAGKQLNRAATKGSG